MKPLSILIDMDDVLENLIDCWVDTLNNQYGTGVTPGDVTTWDIACAFPSLTKEQVFSPLQENSFWKALSPLPNSIYTVKRLMDEGHKIKIVTASYYQTIRSKMEWLFFHFPFIKWDDVIVTSTKQMVHGDVLIDDGVHNLEGGNYEKILFDRPHNRSYDAEENGMFRVFDWDEVYERIRKIVSAKKTVEQFEEFRRMPPGKFIERFSGVQLTWYQKMRLRWFRR